MASNALNSGVDLITSLDPVVAKRTLVQCTDIITESSIDPFTLARKLYSKEVFPEDTYKRVRDMSTRDSNEGRLQRILGHLTDRVKREASILVSFLDILKDLERQDLVVLIVKKYKELEKTAEKEHIIGGSTLQDVLVKKDDTCYQHKSKGLGRGPPKTRLHKLKRASDVSMSISSKKHSKPHDGRQTKMMNEEITTEEKKTVKKPKLMEEYSEQSESSSDNDSEFSGTPSKHIEEEASGLSYRSKEIPNKKVKRPRNEASVSDQSDKRDHNSPLHDYMKQEGHKRKFRKRRQRSESSDSDQSDEDCLPQKEEVSKKHKSFESSSYDISIEHDIDHDVTTMRSYVKEVFTQNFERLQNTSRYSIKSLADKMFTNSLISEEVHRSPTFQNIFDEFIAGIEVTTTINELQDHCVKFITACTNVGGPIAKAADILQKDLISRGMKL